MASFVLVHGAFIGGWAWRRVIPLLRERGHEVYTPTLTGSGDRSHLLRLDTGYETHLDDITRFLEMEDLRDVVLVGHSYGGIVITGVADRAPGRISQLVYLDAQIATHGQNAMGGMPGATTEKLDSMSETAGPRLLPPLSLDAMGIFEPADRAWVEGRLVHHPMKSLEDFVFLEHGEPKMPRSYVYCTERASLVAFFQGDPLAHFVEKARQQNFTFYEIASGHHPMITHPREVVSVLDSIAAARAS